MTRKYETVSASKRGDKSNLGNYKLTTAITNIFKTILEAIN